MGSPSMGSSYGPAENGTATDGNQKIIMHPLYGPRHWPWLDLKVFYVRLSCCEIDESSAEQLTIDHIPLSPDTVIEVNGKRSSIYTEGLSSSLRRDRIDKKSEEATFVSTDSIRITGNARFQVFYKDKLLIVGDLEMCDTNGFAGETKSSSNKWSMTCKAAPTCNVLLRGKPCSSSKSPMIEVYVAGSFSATPIILTHTIQLSVGKRQPKVRLDIIPEDETTEHEEELSYEDSRKVFDTNGFKQETDVDIDYSSLYSRAAHMEGEDGDLSWFNAGVRVGVGIGLGICVGVGIGIGLLVRTYQSTSRNFRRRRI